MFDHVCRTLWLKYSLEDHDFELQISIDESENFIVYWKKTLFRFHSEVNLITFSHISKMTGLRAGKDEDANRSDEQISLRGLM